MPISQAPRRNFLVCQEIERKFGLFRLGRRPAEVILGQGVMSLLDVRINQAPRGKSNRGKEMRPNGFF
jgi:hypothetical protein